MTREHGTRACYVFGPQPGSNRANGCRCHPCAEANRAYARARDRASRRPDEQLAPAYIDATEVLEHLAWLRTINIGRRTVARRARVSPTTIGELTSGRRTRVTPGVADRILAVGRSAAADHALIDAAPTWALIDELLAHGHTRGDIARRLGSTAAQPALQLGRGFVTAANARKVADLHAELMRPVLVARENERARRQRYRDVARAS